MLTTYNISTCTFQLKSTILNVNVYFSSSRIVNVQYTTSNNNSGCQIDKGKPRWRSTRPSNISNNNNNNISTTVQFTKLIGFMASTGETQMIRDSFYKAVCHIMWIFRHWMGFRDPPRRRSTDPGRRVNGYRLQRVSRLSGRRVNRCL